MVNLYGLIIKMVDSLIMRIQSSFLIFFLLRNSVASYEAEDGLSTAHSTTKFFKIEGKVSVHDEKLKGGLL